MNLEPSSEQLALVESVKAVCNDYFSIEKLHQLTDDFKIDAYEPGWQALSDLGLFSLVIDEDKGGVGLGFADAALVFEELGRNVVPGPILGSFLHSLISPESNQDIKKIEVIDPDSTPLVIPNPDFIDGVIAFNDSSVLFQEVKSLELEETIPLDVLTPIATSTTKPDWQQIGDQDLALHLKRVGCILISAFQVGIAEGALNLAVEYAGQREQFKTPIGSFQAVKHMCSDMLTLVEVARAAVYIAAATLDNPDANLDDSISAAKVMASKASSECGQNCVQVYGGIGYTWEAAPHLYLKRAWVLDQSFGSASYHSNWLAESLEA